MKQKKQAAFLTPKQLAERWNMHFGTLSNWRLNGRGPAFYKNEHVVLYPIDKVVEYENAHRRVCSN